MHELSLLGSIVRVALPQLMLLSAASHVTRVGDVESPGTRAGVLEAVHSGFGCDVIALGDVDADRCSDLGIIEHGADAAERALWIVSMRGRKALHRIAWTDANRKQPLVLPVARDWDGDGVVELVYVARPQEAAPSRIEVRSCKTAELLASLAVRDAERIAAIAVIADVDADGTPEVAVGTPTANDGRGRVTLLSGANGTELWSSQGARASETFGDVLATIPDCDGDAVEDLVVGHGLAASAEYQVQVRSGRDGRLVRTIQRDAGRATFPICVVPARRAAAAERASFWLGLCGRVERIDATSGDSVSSVSGSCYDAFGTTLALLNGPDGRAARCAIGAQNWGVGEGQVQLFDLADQKTSAIVSVVDVEMEIWHVANGLAAVGDLDGDGYEDVALATRSIESGSRGCVVLASGASGAVLGRLVRDGDRVREP